MTTIKIEDRESATAVHEDESFANDSDNGAEELPPVDEADRCKYPSKYCGRARVRKSNGTFHRYCEYYRIKANNNQKRWTSVRRQQAALEEQQRRHAEAYATIHGSVALQQYLYAAVPAYHGPGLIPDPMSIDPSPEPVDLAFEDVQILNALFVGEMPHQHPSYQHPYYHPAMHKQQPYEHGDISL